VICVHKQSTIVERYHRSTVGRLITIDDDFAALKMSTRLEPCIPIDFDEKTLEDVVSKAKDWAVMHGLIFQSFGEVVSTSAYFFLKFTFYRSWHEVKKQLQS